MGSQLSKHHFTNGTGFPDMRAELVDLSGIKVIDNCVIIGFITSKLVLLLHFDYVVSKDIVLSYFGTQKTCYVNCTTTSTNLDDRKLKLIGRETLYDYIKHRLRRN